MSAYEVIVTREGDAWLADGPAVAGTHTWAKNLPGLDRNVREAIALAEDLPEGAEDGLDLAYQSSHPQDPYDQNERRLYFAAGVVTSMMVSVSKARYSRRAEVHPLEIPEALRAED
jgi:hypothetical protein